MLDQLPINLKFTSEEEDRGRDGLIKLGINDNSPFVCLHVRDSAYLNNLYNSSTMADIHKYRNSDIQNYILGIKALVDRGYYVIRMGAIVNEALNFNHPNFIDYAANGGSEFMDVYLGNKCHFCITTGSGWDSIPEMFRRPMVYVNMLPLGQLHTFRTNTISITKRHVLGATQETLTLRKIFTHKVGFCTKTSDYNTKGVDIIENTPEDP